MSELKNCPFCDCSKLKFYKDQLDEMIGTSGSVVCTNCSAKAPLRYWSFLGDDHKEELETKDAQIKKLTEALEMAWSIVDDKQISQCNPNLLKKIIPDLLAEIKG